MTTAASATLVVMMPALNEERTVGAVIDGIPRDIPGVGRVGVIVVDDGSTDATGEIARERGAVVIRHPVRMGLGRSFGDGMERALREGADVIVNIDSDGQFNPADIPELIAPILADEADFVTCTRFQDPARVPEMPAVKKWGNRRMCTIVNFATGTTRLTDVSCGFRAFSREAALRMNLFGRFTYTHESIIDLARKGMRIAEVPLDVRGERKHGRSRMASSVFAYGFRAVAVITRAMCYSRPLAFFGGIALLLVLLGLAQGIWILGHWVRVIIDVGGIPSEATDPKYLPRHRILMIGASLFLTLGFLVGILALVADMLGRQIKVADQLLYFARRGHFARGGDGDAEPVSEPAAGEPSPADLS